MSDKKLMIETEIIIPGIAQPEIDKFEKELNNLFLNTLLPKLLIKENAIIKEAVQKMIKKVFRLSFKIFRFSKYSGNLIDQQIICEKGKIKLTVNKLKQKRNAKNFFLPLRSVFLFLLSFFNRWNFDFFLDKFSIVKKTRIKKRSKSDKKFEVSKSSNINQEL